MATLSSLITFLPSLYLFLVLCLCFPERREASKNHVHTVEIASLLPSSVCRPLINGSKRRSQSTVLDVFHRHGPCSPLTSNRPASSLSEILSHDQSRVNSIHARLKPGLNPKETNLKDTKIHFPIQSGESFHSGNYIVTIGLGTPPQFVSLIFETGSSLVWTQCNRCFATCYKQNDPIFDPSKSTSFSVVPCYSPLCTNLFSQPNCTDKRPCVYGVVYGDGSFSDGYISLEKLTIPNTTDNFPDFMFSCGQLNHGNFGKTAGILGLGNDDKSFLRQTAETYGKVFSYCLPSNPSGTGFLGFGNYPKDAKFTPLIVNSDAPELYFIEITSINVGATEIPVEMGVSGTPGVVIDSGTVITRLPMYAYVQMRDEFREQMKNYTSAPKISILDTCYSTSKDRKITTPIVSFIFKGGVKVDLDPSGVLYAFNNTRVCFAFAGNSDSTDPVIFGNTQQKTMEVVYDVAGGRIGFVKGGC